MREAVCQSPRPERARHSRAARATLSSEAVRPLLAPLLLCPLLQTCRSSALLPYSCWLACLTPSFLDSVVGVHISIPCPGTNDKERYRGNLRYGKTGSRTTSTAVKQCYEVRLLRKRL